MTAEDPKIASVTMVDPEMTPGRMLTEARERSGLTSEQAAHDLYMSVNKLRALEENNFDYTGPDTFTRGYLRAYANLLKINPLEVIAAYDTYLTKRGLLNKPVISESQSTNKRLWRFVIVVFVGLLFLWLLTLWFFDKPKRVNNDSKAPALVPLDNEPSLIINKPQEIPATEIFSSDPSVTNSVIESSSHPGSSAKAIVDNAASTTAQVDSRTATPKVPEQKPLQQIIPQPIAQPLETQVKIRKEVVDVNALDEITLSFIEECWLSVTDANQDLLASDLMAPDSSLTLRGMAPFEVKVGNSSAVSITLNGEAVEVVPARNSKVLTLTVGNL